jgi:hypothetical protein
MNLKNKTYSEVGEPVTRLRSITEPDPTLRLGDSPGNPGAVSAVEDPS